MVFRLNINQISQIVYGRISDKQDYKLTFIIRPVQNEQIRDYHYEFMFEESADCLNLIDVIQLITSNWKRQA